MKNKLIKNINILLSLFMICVFNINTTYANDDENTPKGDDPFYQLETPYEFYNENIKSIKTLIKKYDIKIISEETINVRDIGTKDAVSPSLKLILKIPQNEYGNFIQDIKALTQTNENLEITDIYEPVSLEATNKTLTLKILQYNKNAPLIFFIVILGLIIISIYAIVQPPISE